MLLLVTEMGEIVVKVPEDIKHKMDIFPKVDWSKKLEEVVSQELKRQLLLRLADKAFERSELTEEDALRLGEEVKESLHNRFKKEHPEEYG